MINGGQEALDEASAGIRRVGEAVDALRLLTSRLGPAKGLRRLLAPARGGYAGADVAEAIEREAAVLRGRCLALEVVLRRDPGPDVLALGRACVVAGREAAEAALRLADTLRPGARPGPGGGRSP